MAVLDAEVKQRALNAVRILKRSAAVRAAYIFGSQVEGKPHRFSDIDVALFVEGAENWDIRRRARVMAQIQKEAGLDVEAHLFPASALDRCESGTFAAYILKTGTPLISASGVEQ